MKINKNFALPLLSGIFLGFARYPHYLGVIVFFAFIPLFKHIFNSKLSKKQLLAGALGFSLGYVITSLHWIALVTLPGFFGVIPLFTAYFYAVFWFFEKFKKIKIVPKILLFLPIWFTFETFLHYTEFRFPWLQIAYSLTQLPLFVQLAELGGTYLLGTLILFVNYLFYVKSKKAIVSAFLVLIIWVGASYYLKQRIKTTKTDYNIAIVQASIKQKDKWKPENLEPTINSFLELTEKAIVDSADMVIWPESAVPIQIMHYYKYKKMLTDFAKSHKTPIFTGFPHFEFDSNHYEKIKHYNASSLIDTTGILHNPYFKNYLVPFGERMPFLDVFPFLWKLSLGQANFEYGKKLQYFKVNDYLFSPLICFEVVFDELTSKQVQNNVDFIVNQSNDAWFYKSIATFQHANIAKFRAIETRKMIYRAANTGFSMIISPTGSILQKTKLFKKQIIHNKLIVQNQKSFYPKFRLFFIYITLLTFSSILIWLIIAKLIDK